MGVIGLNSHEFKLSEIFDEVCPFYISIGMTYDQFWKGKPELVVYYRKAHELSNRQRNQELWLSGVYFAEAIQSTLGNALSKKGSRKHKYPSEPFPITEEEIAERKERERKHKMEQMKAKFMSKALSVNAKMTSETHK